MFNGFYLKFVLIAFAVAVGVIVGKVFFADSAFLKASIVEYEPKIFEENLLDELTEGYDVTPEKMGEFVEENVIGEMDENGNIYFLDK